MTSCLRDPAMIQCQRLELVALKSYFPSLVVFFFMLNAHLELDLFALHLANQVVPKA